MTNRSRLLADSLSICSGIAQSRLPNPLPIRAFARNPVRSWEKCVPRVIPRIRFKGIDYAVRFRFAWGNPETLRRRYVIQSTLIDNWTAASDLACWCESGSAPIAWSIYSTVRKTSIRLSGLKTSDTNCWMSAAVIAPSADSRCSGVPIASPRWRRRSSGPTISSLLSSW